MKNKDARLSALVHQAKNCDSAQCRLVLPVKDESGKSIGSLVCVDRGLANDARIIAAMTEWRQRFMQYFLTQFEATKDRTRRWLFDVVLPSDDRLMFLIFDDSNRLIGNFGVSHLRHDSAELDNLIRGNKGGAPRLIYFCEIALLAWLFGSLNCERVMLHVFSNNKPTIRLHSSIGFSINKSLSLIRVTKGSDIVYEIDSDEGGLVEWRYLEMVLVSGTFMSTYPWVLEKYGRPFDAYIK